MKRNNQILSKLSKRNKRVRTNNVLRNKMKRKAAINVNNLNVYEKEIYEILKNEYSEDELEKILENGEYRYYPGCNTIEDVAMQLVDDEGIDIFNKGVIEQCIDYNVLGNMLYDDGIWYEGDNGMVQIY